MSQGAGAGVLSPCQVSPALALSTPSDSSPRSLPCLPSWVQPCPCPAVPSVSHPQVGAHPSPLPTGFLERNGKPYCHQDFLAMFAPKCQGCERPVMGNYLSALQGVWHSECFVCTECLTGFSGGSFFELEGRPYCELHFHQRQGTICHGCGRPVSGRCVTAAGRRYHPEHFVCSYCMRRLHKGTFSECGDKMYCQPCYDKLFLSAPVPQHSVPAWMAPASPCLVLSLLTHTRLIPHPSTSLVLIPLSQLSPALLLPSPASFLVPLPARHPWHCPLDLKQ
uniref:LIM zinc-binding domain-containing protein n=1 Tax=Ficedula albicollis TaxID=59894 RepID=U3K8Y9_FICAL